MEIINSAIEILRNETHDLYLGNEIPIESNKLSPLEFHRNYVSKNIPVLLKSYCNSWPAVQKWNSNYFRNLMPDKVITVALTPNGLADGISYDKATNQNYFVLPDEKKMTMREFLNLLDEPKPGIVPYIQKQNSNLLDFEELKNDVYFHLDLATEAFGKNPDAINFWMGDNRAITSSKQMFFFFNMHKDPYENMYCVIEGRKEFCLIPPTDLYAIPYKLFPIAKYKFSNYQKSNLSQVEPLKSELNLDSQIVCSKNKFPSLNWIDIDPINPNLEIYPEFKNAHIYNITVEKGDCLYLPSLWFHHVRQSHQCIAINYWYDMEYDIKYCYYKMLEELCKIN